MLITQPLEDPFRGVLLLIGNLLIRLKDLINDPRKPIKLQAPNWLATSVPRRYLKNQHLLNCAAGNPEYPSRFPTAHALNQNSVTNAPIQIHSLHPRSPSKRRAYQGRKN